MGEAGGQGRRARPVSAHIGRNGGFLNHYFRLMTPVSWATGWHKGQGGRGWGARPVGDAGGQGRWAKPVAAYIGRNGGFLNHYFSLMTTVSWATGCHRGQGGQGRWARPVGEAGGRGRWARPLGA